MKSRHDGVKRIGSGGRLSNLQFSDSDSNSLSILMTVEISPSLEPNQTHAPIFDNTLMGKTM